VTPRCADPIMFEQILFPVDQSRETSHATNLVADMAQRYNSRLILLSVLDDSALDPAQLPQARQMFQGLLQQSEAAFQKVGIPAIKSEYREGRVPFVICDVADELGVDLIIMGSRGLGAGEDISHSVSNRVINLAPCPVLVVP
jgi:nucleotide-binding universal stress UspA family protein